MGNPLSGIGGLFSGSNGSAFQSQQAQVDKPSTVDEANVAEDQTQRGLYKQQQFVNALQNQNGINNQSSVFNQLQGVANGTGPNPAQAQLAQSTAANTANQAALMASQRGANANAGLIARQAAMQGGANQQAAAGQAATLQANQSLGALNQLGGIAGQQVGQQGNAIQAYDQAAQGQQADILNGIAGQNNAAVANAGQYNSAQSKIAAGNQSAQTGMLGSLAQGAGKLFGMIGNPFSSKGLPGQSPSPGSTDAGGGATSSPTTDAGGIGGSGGAGASVPVPEYTGGQISDPNVPKSAAARHLKGIRMASGGTVPALLSPGELKMSKGGAEAVDQGKASVTQVSEKVPGKASVKGNSLKNDTVHANLNDGDIIIPRSITQGPNAAANAAKFVHETLNKKRAK